MAEYYNVTTNLGDAEIANAIATNTKLNITHVAFGDGNGAVPTPNKTRTTLVREVHRQAVTKYERHPTNANWIVIETIIPSNVGGFTIREMGIIANSKLISHGSHAPFEKTVDPSGVSEYRLRFVQNITDASVVSIILDQSLIYATQEWVEEFFVKRVDIINNLTTAESQKALSANMGKKLQDDKLGKTENAVSASKLETARTISFSGAATGSTSFDGSGNASAVLTLANSGVTASTYGENNKIPVITVNAKGLITVVSEKTIPEVVDATTTVKGIIRVATDNEVKTGANAVVAVTPSQLSSMIFGGSSHRWTDMILQRVFGVAYTNTTGRGINIMLSLNMSNSVDLYINGVRFETGPTATIINITVPNNTTYEVRKITSTSTVSTSTVKILGWMELR